MGKLASEVDCINTCIVGQGALQTYINYSLIATIIISGMLLIFSHKKLSVKLALFLKAVFLTSIFAFLISLFFAQHNGIFETVHVFSLFLIILFFAISYLFSPFLAQLGLKRIQAPEIDGMLFEESERLKIKAPRIFVFNDANKSAFVVSGLRKTIFVSTGLIENLDESDVRVVLIHELLHLRKGFFNAKRFLHSIRAGFFGLLPVHLEELDTIEEMRVDNELLQKGLDIKKVKQKL